MMIHERNDKIWEHMKSDCSKCSGLCCTALFFSKMDGFPKDKASGQPCVNLLKDYRCKIHSQLEKQKMKGCIGYDCFGAGQQVTQVIYQGQTWNEIPNQSKEIFDVFIVVFHLYQIRYYLIEALSLISARPLEKSIKCLIEENVEMCHYRPDSILSLDIEEYRQRANHILKQACRLLQQGIPSANKKVPANLLGGNFKGQDMSGADLSTKLLIAANFEKCRFHGTVFLGADTRDANFKNADLSEAVFLTQGQVNSAKGNRNTKLPYHLEYPPTWK
ncbi:pentapeptide repeat-containing protein [Bariatricus massiliensis]|uniref:Pentapeptide repeat-containing protein n=1 Tax=Bariatricus massiliensis TaxID=1745713 RepID=A0ABS8DDR0_9FIRM|nr:pentapeptide repeat-containing protein [Bariatricus massiliensis]MCB7302661.1 pentapeptide repeat-containing protein [Bariatricus massiliensis]MCB7373877.1 pentapeptide repeat-containing protein [Bariatricus massiliensis]MCB7386547.1 pentapeptide repeat-containing protein [Bariatricus massiliensis]MCB7410709.1 pentapeptide repeat-containing protein [Bariatricus massiliensis]MDY2662462.1 pentapeptide repeat-containing protein [Bariatricus massiliensis]